MFEKTLTDVVKGIRASKRDTSLYISQCIAEIKTEINSSDMFVKANALQKLTFLQMMGYGMSWASFASIEVMSSNRFAHKRIAYLSASQGFTQDTEVILLTTNLLKKELRSAITPNMQGVYEAGLAINCISNIVTEDLARDLLPELTNLTSHPQPYLRKKAILCLFKVFVKYPQGLRLTFAQIQQCLEDQNPSVVSCAVNVITELSDKNPRNYLHLAPSFFQLLTTSSNNWMLIKVVKLLGSLVPEEPRLARKLLDPLANIVRNTQAKSLLYEAVHTITLCLPYCRKNDGSMPSNVPEIVTLCAETLQNFVKESDQNLKYLGLVGFASLMQSHPRVLSAPGYRPLILTCLSDQDITIRTRALGLLKGMASRKNLIELVSQLLKHVDLATHSYKIDLVTKIVEMCSGEKYALLQDFAWYLDVLFKLGHMRGLDSLGDMLRIQITDVALRVLPVRSYAVRRSIQIMLEGKINRDFSSNDPYGDNGRGRHIMPEILPAIAWITGEYSDLMSESDIQDFLLDKRSKGVYHAVVQALVAPSNCQELCTGTQKVFVQAAMKVFAAATADRKVKDMELEACLNTLKAFLPLYMQSTDVEVQERAFTANALLAGMDLISDFDDNDDLTPPPVVSTISSDSDEVDDGDLLGMEKGSAPSKPEKKNGTGLSSVPRSLASKCRSVSVMLNYVLKPSPMKPISAKAQRKKLQAFDCAEIDLEKPVDLDVFAEFIEEEKNFRAANRPSMEAVSFTQQKPVRVQEHVSANVGAINTHGAASGDSLLQGNTSSFQKAGIPDSTMETSGFNARNTQGDPFYLNSAPSNNPGPTDGNDPNRFGTIQLLDSDDDEDESQDKKKKKRKKKEKRNKSKQKDNHQYDLNFPSYSDELAGPKQPVVYESDDDDNDMFKPSPAERRHKPKKGPGKEFEGLARVDLTAPLREDEVMPERKHREVPDRSTASAPAADPFAEKKKSKKNKKKEKKDKKKEKKNSLQASGGGAITNDGVGDLLDLAGFDAGPSAPAPASTAPAPLTMAPAVAPSLGVMSQGTGALAGDNRISSAFDDLLGLETPVPAPQILPSSTSLASQNLTQPTFQPTNQKSSKRPWIRASLKASNSSGFPGVDWSKIVLLFRVYRTSQGQAAAAMISFRVDNHSDTPLNNLSLTMKNLNVALGSVGPGSSFESNKVGPLNYSQVDLNQDYKGTLATPECNVPIKISLPASVHLAPIEGLTYDDLAQQISSLDLSSSSLKIEMSSGIPQEGVKPLLCNYLRSAEVKAGASETPTTGTLAAQSAMGAKVFLMLKVKGKSTKIDIKCTNPQLGKALTSDLKKIVL